MPNILTKIHTSINITGWLDQISSHENFNFVKFQTKLYWIGLTQKKIFFVMLWCRLSLI